MSYIPMIVIHKPSLINKQKDIANFFSETGPTEITQEYRWKIQAYKYLVRAIDQKAFILCNVEMVCIFCAVTSVHTQIRKALHDLNIEFTVEY